jgi:hypothetical protein
MTWKGFWEAIASLFENVLFIPYDALMKVELDSWLLANAANWVFVLIGAGAFIYWLIKLKNFNESNESTYTYKENH